MGSLALQTMSQLFGFVIFFYFKSVFLKNNYFYFKLKKLVCLDYFDTLILKIIKYIYIYYFNIFLSIKHYKKIVNINGHSKTL